MSDEQAMVVQFPHPGREHVPRGDEMAWNAGGHGRKFIAANGDLVDADDHRERDVTFTSSTSSASTRTQIASP